MPSFEIIKVRTAQDIATICTLFNAYTAWLDIDLTFQDYAAELASLPGKYAPPTGELFLALRRQDDVNNATTGPSSKATTSLAKDEEERAPADQLTEALGCIAIRPLSSKSICEVKRLYVVPSARGMGVGNALIKTALEWARDHGYEEAMLDTLPSMQSAIRMYKRMGFVECEKYYNTPLQGTVFMKADVRRL